MKNIKTKISKFWKENKEEIIITAVGVVGVCLVADYIMTKSNMNTLKKIASKTVDYGTDLCIEKYEEVNKLVDKGLGESEECIEKCSEYLIHRGQLAMAESVKKTLDNM